MAKKPETLFKERLLAKIRARKIPDIYIKKLVAGSVGGIPDLLICVQGFLVMPELKIAPASPTPLQWHNIEAINAAGGTSFPLYPEDEDAFVDWLETLSRGE